MGWWVSQEPIKVLSQKVSVFGTCHAQRALVQLDFSTTHQPWRARGSRGGAEEPKSEAGLERGCQFPQPFASQQVSPPEKASAGGRLKGVDGGSFTLTLACA